MRVCALIRSEGLTAVILDIDHAVAHLPADAGDFGAAVLAEAMADAGLKRFALVHRGHEDPWWDGVVEALCKLDVAACGFDTVAAAKAWLPGPETGTQS